MELTRQWMRQRALHQFKHIKTCILARELCLLIRTNRVAFNAEDVRDCCGFVATLCEEAGCKEQSELCRQAAEAVINDEREYLKLCEQSCMKCGESRRPPPRRTEYIT